MLRIAFVSIGEWGALRLIPMSTAAGSMAGTAINADLVAEDIAAAVR